jgi:archaemetzincin
VIAVYQQKGLDFFSLIAQSLEDYLNSTSRRADDFDIPYEAYNSLRRQYNPEYIVKEIAKFKGSHDDYRLGVIDVDIYTCGLNFIFGLAHPLRRIALISAYRLSGPQLLERIAKEVVHETGHLFGLSHCEDPYCVMYFSNTVADTDNKGKNLCSQCRRKIEA